MINDKVDAPQPIPLLGYTDKLSVRAGDTVGFKVSSLSDASYSAELVRVICADPNPDGPGIIEEPVSSSISGSYESREQRFYPGSWIRTDKPLQAESLSSFSMAATVFPTLIQDGVQTIMTCGDISLKLRNGKLSGELGGRVAEAEAPLQVRRWYHVKLAWNQQDQTLSITQQVVNSSATVKRYSSACQCESLTVNAPVTIAAQLVDDHGEQCFNGKIEAPKIHGSSTGADALLAHWDFSVDISSLSIHDQGPHNLHGTIINMPARAMTGSNWDGTEMCWRHAPEQYGAIHFHDDDIIDFNWQTDLSFTIPDDLPSGIYAAKITCDGYTDSMPFFVSPPRGKRSADLAVLVSTFTYSVYGNHARPDFTPAWKDHFKAWSAYPWNPAEYPEYGMSTYNFHHDGSGICHASHRRPLFNLKPGYVTFGYGPGSGLRHFQADSHLIAWLHNQGINYDIVTDDDLHQYGVDCLRGYKTVTTGSHPEYHTTETLNALRDYSHGSGGNLVYLGGNGFYWKVALHPQQEGAIEIRRAEGGIRAWAAEPGEYYQAFDGQYGGLWRRNGRPPQELVGIGFSAQGQFEGSAYRRHKASYDKEFDWLFNGIDDEILGDFGLSGGGAAGFELDRADIRLGTPESATVLASSFDRGKTFVLVPEEQLTHITTWSGEPIEDLLRADLVYFETESGGRVFSTGSITFCGSLPHNNFDNNISRLIANVIGEFCGQ
jgi:N,N-dimethylformamidase